MGGKDRLQSMQAFEKRPEIQFGLILVNRVRAKVLPVYGIKERDVPVNQVSHDFNYQIDVVAEDEIRSAFEELWAKGINYGYVTEDQGLVIPPSGSCEFIFMIDPVDGSRPAQIGAENACITMVGIRGDKKDATFSDIEFGITHAIKEDKTYVSEKGKGVYEVVDGRLVEIKKRQNVSGSLSDATLVYETYSMDPEYLGVIIKPLAREISFKTEFPSGSYAALSVVRGQNEIDVDVRRRLVLDYPSLPVALKPSSKSLSPMDIASGWLMIQELGGKVTDAYGNPLDQVKLWQFNKDGSWSLENQISFIAAITPVLHQKAFEKLQEGFRNFGQQGRSILKVQQFLDEKS